MPMNVHTSKYSALPLIKLERDLILLETLIKLNCRGRQFIVPMWKVVPCSVVHSEDWKSGHLIGMELGIHIHTVHQSGTTALQIMYSVVSRSKSFTSEEVWGSPGSSNPERRKSSVWNYVQNTSNWFRLFTSRKNWIPLPLHGTSWNWGDSSQVRTKRDFSDGNGTVHSWIIFFYSFYSLR